MRALRLAENRPLHILCYVKQLIFLCWIKQARSSRSKRWQVAYLRIAGSDEEFLVWWVSSGASGTTGRLLASSHPGHVELRQRRVFRLTPQRLIISAISCSLLLHMQRGRSGCLSVGHGRQRCKTAESIEMSFAVCTFGAQWVVFGGWRGSDLHGKGNFYIGGGILGHAQTCLRSIFSTAAMRPLATVILHQLVLIITYFGVNFY